MLMRISEGSTRIRITSASYPLFGNTNTKTRDLNNEADTWKDKAEIPGYKPPRLRKNPTLSIQIQPHPCRRRLDISPYFLTMYLITLSQIVYRFNSSGMNYDNQVAWIEYNAYLCPSSLFRTPIFDGLALSILQRDSFQMAKDMPRLRRGNDDSICGGMGKKRWCPW